MRTAFSRWPSGFGSRARRAGRRLDLEGLDPGVDLEGRPDSLAPIHIVVEQIHHLLLGLGLVDPEDVAAGFRGPQGDQYAVILLALQPREMLLAVRGALLQRVLAVGPPENKAHGSAGVCEQVTASHRRRSAGEFWRAAAPAGCWVRRRLCRSSAPCNGSCRP